MCREADQRSPGDKFLSKQPRLNILRRGTEGRTARSQVRIRQVNLTYCRAGQGLLHCARNRPCSNRN